MLPEELVRLTRRGIAEIIPEAEFMHALESGRQLRLKMGFDPTAPDIHLGHAVGLRKLRQLQTFGHIVVLIVGDRTAQIGDPSGRSTTRPMLSPAEVEANAATYLEQFFRIVDRSRTEVRRQSEWFAGFGLEDVLRLTARFTVAQMLERDDFRKRYEAGQPIAVLEFLYPMLQAYDSTQIGADVEFGGTDQKFNCLLGRELQGLLGQRQQQVVLVPLLLAPDGRKMSKSYGNAIGITDPPDDMYGKLMSLPDELMPTYYRLLTDVPDAEIDAIAAGAVHPRQAKARLAREIVGQFHGDAAAAAAEAAFDRVFSRRETPETMPELILPAPEEGLVDVAMILAQSGLVASKGAARRLVAQGAVEVDGVSLATPRVEAGRIADGAVLRVGKRTFLRLRWQR